MSVVNDLNENLEVAIKKNPFFDGRNLRFESEQGKVKLSGRVATFFEKQMAQEAVLRIAGVEQIENDLEVSWLKD